MGNLLLMLIKEASDLILGSAVRNINDLLLVSDGRYDFLTCKSSNSEHHYFTDNPNKTF